jgi:hypothetical protein
MGKEAIQARRDLRMQDLRDPSLFETILAFIQTLNSLGLKKVAEEPSNPEDHDEPET